MAFDLVYLTNELEGRTPTVVERLGPFDTQDEALLHRRVSGQLLVYSGTVNVVENDSWLWDWERKDDSCYAARNVAMARGDYDAYALERGEL